MRQMWTEITELYDSVGNSWYLALTLLWIAMPLTSLLTSIWLLVFDEYFKMTLNALVCLQICSKIVHFSNVTKITVVKYFQTFAYRFACCFSDIYYFRVQYKNN